MSDALGGDQRGKNMDGDVRLARMPFPLLHALEKFAKSAGHRDPSAILNEHKIPVILDPFEPDNRPYRPWWVD